MTYNYICHNFHSKLRMPTWIVIHQSFLTDCDKDDEFRVQIKKGPSSSTKRPLCPGLDSNQHNLADAAT